MNADTLQKFREVDRILNDNWDAAAYNIYLELSCADLLEPEIIHLTNIALEIYQDTEYATSTGLGCVIVEYVRRIQDTNPEYDCTKITIGNIRHAYECSDWS